MFTGIISHTTKVNQAKKVSAGLVISFEKPKQWTDLVMGESVSIDGVCLTVNSLNSVSFGCTLVPETLKKTTLGRQIPRTVNLERALKAGQRLGGHFVQGHIDCTAEVVSSEKTGSEIKIAFPARFKKLVINKGSVAINGVSLTVAKSDGNQLAVALIPYTLEHTNLGDLKVGNMVNLEFDMLGKYMAEGL